MTHRHLTLAEAFLPNFASHAESSRSPSFLLPSSSPLASLSFLFPVIASSLGLAFPLLPAAGASLALYIELASSSPRDTAARPDANLTILLLPSSDDPELHLPRPHRARRLLPARRRDLTSPVSPETRKPTHLRLTFNLPEPDPTEILLPATYPSSTSKPELLSVLVTQPASHTPETPEALCFSLSIPTQRTPSLSPPSPAKPKQQSSSSFHSLPTLHLHLPTPLRLLLS